MYLSLVDKKLINFKTIQETTAKVATLPSNYPGTIS